MHIPVNGHLLTDDVQKMVGVLKIRAHILDLIECEDDIVSAFGNRNDIRTFFKAPKFQIKVTDYSILIHKGEVGTLRLGVVEHEVHLVRDTCGAGHCFLHWFGLVALEVHHFLGHDKVAIFQFVLHSWGAVDGCLCRSNKQPQHHQAK